MEKYNAIILVAWRINSINGGNDGVMHLLKFEKLFCFFVF